MSQSRVKAALARAYSKGVEPQYVSLAPSGRDEMWAVDDMAFLVPVVPADASLELQFALRVRRNALLTGKCDECGAIVGTAFTWQMAGTDVAGTLIPHRMNCPAADDLVRPQIEEYYDTLADSDIIEDIDAASKRTKERIEAQQAGGINLSEHKYGDWAQRLIDKKLDETIVELCDHLQANVAQTWGMLLGLDRWHCDECWTYLEYEIQYNGFRLDPIEDYTCDYCGRYVFNLTPLVVRVGNFLMRGGMCSRCAEAGTSSSLTADVRGSNV